MQVLLHGTESENMQSLCSLYVHYMFTNDHYIFTICSLYVHYMFAIRSLYVHYMFTMYSLYIHCMFTYKRIAFLSWKPLFSCRAASNFESQRPDRVKSESGVTTVFE